MTYHQLTSEERYMLSACRAQGLNQAQIARQLGRHRSTIGREVKRNSSRADGHYRPSKAIERTHGRRSRSRRNQRFTADELHCVEALLRQQRSPEQVSGFLRKEQRLQISHETIYRHVWHDRRCGGTCMSICVAHASAASANAIAPMQKWVYFRDVDCPQDWH